MSSTPQDQHAADVLAGVDVGDAADAVAQSGVYADDGDPGQIEALRELVAQSRSEGLDLSIIVVPSDQWDTHLASMTAYPERLRDLSTAVGGQEGGTVVALSPGQIGSYSDSLSRFTLESAEKAVENTYDGDTATVARTFTEQVQDPPGIPWTALSAALLLITVVIVAVGTAWNVARADSDTAA